MMTLHRSRWTKDINDLKGVHPSDGRRERKKLVSGDASWWSCRGCCTFTKSFTKKASNYSYVDFQLVYDVIILHV